MKAKKFDDFDWSVRKKRPVKELNGVPIADLPVVEFPSQGIRNGGYQRDDSEEGEIIFSNKQKNMLSKI